MILLFVDILLSLNYIFFPFGTVRQIHHQALINHYFLKYFKSKFEIDNDYMFTLS